MLHITGLLGLLFWLAVIPFCIGLIPANFIAVKKRGPGFVLLAGYFVMWALFEVVTIPAVLFVKYDNFKVASACFMTGSLLCAAAGVWLAYRNRKTSGSAGSVRKSQAASGASSEREYEYDTNVRFVGRIMRRMIVGIKRMSWAERIEWLLFFGLLGFQLYKAAAYASFDGDDAYYVVESLIAQQADVMYRILPYTGRPTDLDIRHALAVFPMWAAFIATKSGIHATIVSHTILPLVLIPLSYLVYYEIGKQLFKTGSYGGEQGEKARNQTERKQTDTGGLLQRENLPIFMIVMAMFQIFGNVSIYTNETFFLTRTWQGKAVAGSLVIPALFWMFLWIFDDEKKAVLHGTGMRRKDATGKKAGRQQAEMTGKDAGMRRAKVAEHDSGARKHYHNAGLWLVFVCINMTAGVCSSIAVFLVCILMALTGFVLAVTERDLKVLLKMGAVCIPNVIYMAVYVIVAYSYLLK